jgi:hypothetical protein
MAEVKELDGTGLWVCGQCGDTVTGKVIERGASHIDPLGFSWKHIDYLGVNMPCGHDAIAFHFPGDDDCLRRAAEIMKRRSAKPNGIGMRALTHVLCETADKIEAEG